MWFLLIGVVCTPVKVSCERAIVRTAHYVVAAIIVIAGEVQHTSAGVFKVVALVGAGVYARQKARALGVVDKPRQCPRVIDVEVVDRRKAIVI